MKNSNLIGGCLLDVNVLIALLDASHEHNQLVRRWFLRQQENGWATCPITENGFLRIVSSTAYPNLRITPGEAASVLNGLKQNFFRNYRFWPNDISLADPAIFDLGLITGARQTTDLYLAGLAKRNAGHLATLDDSVSWKAVRGATAKLIERITP
jgi:toxin-antitoxin system PIN domain toxin